ncbi:MAG: RagB/SusD family nutrient uptake outer membrane protein [Bacteroidia bacterium]|nr:RagB/SusD family nutrient uptake outer membrane protein [Bacteroidia bacterium]
MKKILAVMVIISITFSACQKMLDIEFNDKILNENAIKTTRDLELVLIGAYDALQGLLGGNLVVHADLMADDTRIDNNSKLNYFGKYEIYNRMTTEQIQELTDVWSSAYTAINRANNVIYAIDNNLVSDYDFDANKDRIKGEALFIRAVSHFEIVRFFALPYNVAQQGSNTQLGVPYRKEPVLDAYNVHIARSTVEEVYNNVISDLTESDQLLQITGCITSVDWTSQMAAVSYLARVYFQKGDYIKASECAGDVINSDNYQLDTVYSNIFKLSGNTQNGEIIFQLVNIETDNYNAIIDNYSYNKNPLFQALKSVYNLYLASDQRRTMIYSMLNVVFYIKKYDQDVINGVAQPLNRLILRLAEMHLIRAEANLSQGGSGNIPEARESYDALRARAFGSSYIPDTVLASDLLDSVQLERRRELVFEGDRFHNLRRLQQPVRDGVAWNDPSLVFKIPAHEVSGNNLMIQNP